MPYIERTSPSWFFLFVVILAFSAHVPARAEERVRDDAASLPTATVEQAGRYDAELTAVRERVKADPSNAADRVRLGYLLIGRGELDDAMVSFNEALTINPRLHDAMTGRGIILARKGNLTEAEQALKQALFLNPNPVRAHYELGLVYGLQGDSEKAVAEFKAGIEKHEQGR